MKKSLTLLLFMLASVLSVGVSILMPSFVYAGDAIQLSDKEKAICTGAGGTVTDIGCDTGDNAVGDTIKNVASLLIFIVGLVAVIMIIIGGIKYATSNGDQSSVTNAKNTILYSIVGLIIAMLSYGIVDFVSRRF